MKSVRDWPALMKPLTARLPGQQPAAKFGGQVVPHLDVRTTGGELRSEAFVNSFNDLDICPA